MTSTLRFAGITIGLAAAGGLALASPAHADKGHGPHGKSHPVKAIVFSVPGGGPLGSYSIGGVDYIVDANTVLKVDKAPLAVGACAEVKFTAAGSPAVNTAQRLETRPIEACSKEFKGRISAVPAGGTAGMWTIGGKDLMADANTKFKLKKGPLVVDGCAQGKYVVAATGNVAIRIESREMTSCLPKLRHAKGIVTVAPTPGPAGTWTIGGRVYVASDTTIVDATAGPVAVDACVEVKYFVDAGSANIAVQLQSKPLEKCTEAHD